MSSQPWQIVAPLLLDLLHLLLKWTISPIGNSNFCCLAISTVALREHQPKLTTKVILLVLFLGQLKLRYGVPITITQLLVHVHLLIKENIVRLTLAPEDSGSLAKLQPLHPLPHP